MKKKKLWIPLVIGLILVTLYLGLPALILRDLNAKGATGSKTVVTHIDQLYLTVPFHLKMENLTVTMRSNGVTIFKGKHSRIGLNWKELLRGRLLFWASLQNYSLQYAPEYADGLNEVLDYLSNPAPTIKFSEIAIKESSVIITRYPGVNRDKYFTLHDLKGSLSNLQLSLQQPIIRVRLTSEIYGVTNLMLHASFNNLIKPKEWDLDFVLEKMQLPDLNLVLKKELPLIFKSGTLDVYAEAQSRKGHIKGYLKPFLNDVVIDENDPIHKQTGNMIMSFLADYYKDKKLKSLSTWIPLIMEGPLNVDYSEILSSIYEKGLKSKESRGLEHSMKL